ncbi:MAG: hypothetical protein CML06_16320 [Pseudomonadales bacterium]|nr:hypothetical protein [Pseudomonadales bacterium]
MTAPHAPGLLWLGRLCYLLAWIGSLVLLFLMRQQQVPLYLALLAVAVCVAWYGAYRLRGQPPAPSSMPLSPERAAATEEVADGNSAELYFDRLLTGLSFSWRQCSLELDQAQSLLSNVRHALVEATANARSTGMLALNSMISAAHTGEVGRGFVTVSRDLVAISEQSSEDLASIERILTRVDARLGQTRGPLARPLSTYLDNPAAAPIQTFQDIVNQVQSAQESLRRIADRYQRSSQADVRWLQLGDAVRRLLNEVINVLYQFELRLTDVISDMRLLKLSGTLSAHQMSELQDHLNTGAMPEISG